ncbi:hypothetical protein MBM_03524 [Drepanopeziza brunnea f. sp. 'multigermtubi' MB_m1]|uniref:Uncharacterized protein n=1 Tax=Marssonina brunnea f. sp. multigermtubi (strain MB_m1) TaxID=1072389 RepID=K1WZX5_MARBU|nr:uncharacterized protein MBM_03524 [Drepanopeziza brunnea f. sp. 'multigermtubi' MB_m1]EKD18531.1 hypothetical protein MBM_03524 [Drepanopeziza brunnea f. sp. 'multigermtubi' MB_m1]
MPPGKQEVQLGDSWVVEGEDENEDPSYSPQDDEYKPPPPRRSSRRGTTSPESELVIPSVDFNSMDGSWADTKSRSTTRARAKQSAERVLGTRRRNERVGNGSLVKRPAAKTATKEHPPTTLIDRSSSSNNNINSTNLQDIVDVGAEHLTAVMSWLLDVFTGALKVLKKPLSYFLAIWLLFGILITVRNLVTNSIYASMSPLCRIPGSSFLNLPFCPVHLTDSSHGATPEFNDLMSVQAKFEEVLEESAGGVSLPLDMKRGEASIRDLRQLVRYSQLQSKNELVLEFDGFIETSRIASYDLQKFNSHVGRAVDGVIATTRWTTRVLDGIQERDGSRGSISAFVNEKLLAPFQPVKFTERILLDQYVQHTRIVEEEINNLIAEAQAVLMVLTNLEDRLDVIHGIAIRDNVHTKALKEEILSELWTMVGGNRGKINKMDRKLDLLKQVGIYRKTAYAHVSGTIIRLQAMGAGLEDLRERVGSPELLRDRIDIPLEVHLESIMKGVERLEESRLKARKLEDKHIRRTLERGRLEGTMIDG